MDCMHVCHFEALFGRADKLQLRVLQLYFVLYLALLALFAVDVLGNNTLRQLVFEALVGF